MKVGKKMLLAASSLPAAFYCLGIGALATVAVIPFKLIKSLVKVLKVIKHKLSYLDLEDITSIGFIGLLLFVVVIFFGVIVYSILLMCKVPL